MTLAKLTNCNYIELKSTMGKNFISYECERLDRFNRTYGNIRLNFTNLNIDICNEQKTLIFFKELEDVAYFEMYKVNADLQFKPYIEESIPEKYDVVEIVQDIIIIEDTIHIKDEYSIQFDMAIQINTFSNSYIFSKGWFFDEHIYISKNKNFDDVYSIEKVVSDWTGDGEYLENVKVLRKYTSLKDYTTT